MKTAFLVDSTSRFPKEYLDRPDIFEINFSAVFANDEAVYDSVDESCLVRFRELRESIDEKPLSAQPLLGQINDVYEVMVNQGYERVFYICIGSKFSGCLQSVISVSQEFEDQIQTHLFDSLSAVTTTSVGAELLIALVEEGASVDTINQRIEQFLNESKVFFILKQIETLQQGGRLEMSQESAKAHNVVKPLLHITDDGRLEVFEKFRSDRRRHVYLMEYLDQYIEKYGQSIRVSLFHAFAPEDMEEIKSKIYDKYPDIRVDIRQLPPSIMCHTDLKGYIVGFDHIEK